MKMKKWKKSKLLKMIKKRQVRTIQVIKTLRIRSKKHSLNKSPNLLRNSLNFVKNANLNTE